MTIPATVNDRDAWRTLTEIDRQGEGLTQWEIDFVESLMQQLLTGKMLSDKQNERLRQIAEDRL